MGNATVVRTFDDMRHRAWVPGRRRYGGDSFRGDARAEFLEEMLDGAIRAHRAFLRPVASSKRALVALEGELDENYRAVKAATYAWPPA